MAMNFVAGEESYFSWLDFLLFGIMLGSSALIGIYFGYCGKKENTIKEYLLGGKSMNAVLVAISLVSSTTSAVSILGVPSEMYMHGTLYWLHSVASLIVAVIYSYFYLPVFHELQLTSTYEYLELRFSRSVRIMASVLCTINILLYVPVVVYVPALALSQVMSVNLHHITPIITLVCIFYTMLGGMKAVIWTDVIQGVAMIVASVAIIIYGVSHVGGFDTIWERNSQGGRIRIFEMDPSPFERLTFWSAVTGHTFLNLTMASNQPTVQKLLSISTLAEARKAVYIFFFGMVVIIGISCFTGLLLFAEYYNCDPLTTKDITKPDQLLTHYVTHVASYIPGLPGLFVAGVTSAALSTLSSSLNSLGAIMFEDFIRPHFKEGVTDKTANNTIKVIVVTSGVLCIAMAYVVEKLGLVMQLVNSIGGITEGAKLGLFTFGMFIPRGNAKGALAGGISSLAFMSWMVFGTQQSMIDGKIKNPGLPRSTEGCSFNVTLPQVSKLDDTGDEVFALYKISFMYYTVIGFVIVIVVGSIVSYLTEPVEIEKMNPSVFTPLVRNYINKNKKGYKGCNAKELELLQVKS